LLINSDFSLKICDFGFARMASGKLNDMTDYVATRWYRAPELLLSDKNYGKKVDQWAIGCIMGELIDGEPLFPGESEIDQLYLIQKMLGPLTQEQYELFAMNPRYLGYRFPIITKPETLENRYLGKASKQMISLMNGLLQMDPNKRISSKFIYNPLVEEALAHPYFEGFNFILSKKNPKSKTSFYGNNFFIGKVHEHKKSSLKPSMRRSELETINESANRNAPKMNKQSTWLQRCLPISSDVLH